MAGLKIAVGGPPCTMFSAMGKLKGTCDPVYKTHRRFTDVIADDYDVAIVENVPDYPEKGLLNQLRRKSKAPWKMAYLVIDPRLLGFLAARTRKYIIAWPAET